jgi:hypothetical protein
VTICIRPGAKLFEITGGYRTVRAAAAEGFPGTGVSLLLTPDVILDWTPLTELVTTTVTVQLDVDGIVRPERVIFVNPALNVFPEAPEQVPPAGPVEEICMLGRLSLNVTPVSGMFPGLVRVKVSVLVPPGEMVEGANAFEIAGTPATTR